jgi:hypothetical protein
MEKNKKTPKEAMMNVVEEREKYGQILPKYGQHAIFGGEQPGVGASQSKGKAHNKLDSKEFIQNLM